MKASNIERLKKLEARYRGDVIEASLRNAADALARDAGIVKPPPLRRDHTQFPFPTVVEKQANQIEARYHRLLDAAPDALLVVDDNRQLVVLNQRAEHLFGYARGELIGKPVTTILPTGFAERVLVVLAGTALGKELAEQIDAPLNFSGQRRDRSAFPIEATLSPVQGIDGMLVIASLRDATLRSVTERRRTAQMDKFRGLIETAPDAMIVANRREKITLVNGRAEALFGYEAGALMGQKITTVLSAAFSAHALAAAEGGAIGAPVEIEGRHKDGSVFPAEITIGWSDDNDGRVVTTIIRDISARQDESRRLIEMEARYRGLLDAAPDALVAVDAKGSIVFVSQLAETMFGYRREDLLLLSITKLIPTGLVERLIADDWWSVEMALAHRTGIGLELDGRKKNGVAFPVEIMLNRMDAADGVLVTAAIRDISIRKDAGGRA